MISRRADQVAPASRLVWTNTRRESAAGTVPAWICAEVNLALARRGDTPTHQTETR
ncbi:hypothetical protein OG552_11060 [Streptomyces sp. NBC_01476]|uniref:hypothetical protein n=1 Tax=Streptomyces sp. NBC_01476 TaxID=2903881 RepID=UPI002E2EF248|nr:hypothetical protein [Streptomyces sp. NBC_01476]